MILVTGSKGQLGSELQRLQSIYPFEFHFTDADKLDITDASSVNELFKLKPFKYCINAAAYTAVDTSEKEKLAAYEVNVVGTTNLAKACQAHQVRLIHVSTDFVFDGKEPTPYTESDPTRPLGVYGNTKMQSEKVALTNCPQSIIIRTAWLYSSFGKNFVKTMLRVAENNPTLRVVYDLIGSPTYAKDLADVILDIILQMEKAKTVDAHLWGIYHYSNEGVASWFDFAKAIFELANIAVEVTPIRTHEYPTPAARPSNSLLDKSKIKENFHINIPYWRDSLQRCLDEMESLEG